MKIFYLITIFSFGFFQSTAQIENLSEKFALPTLLNESSGAIFFNDKLITHNDSGGENKLYELDTITGLITRTVTVSNATNVDWEDLAEDENFIYVGDIGNIGSRTDLKIYKIDKNDFVKTTEVLAEIINFNYANQSDFTSNPGNTEWDADALVSIDQNNLALFSKDWVENESRAYLIPKKPGSYSISPMATSYNGGGLVTGATYNPTNGKLFLVGYQNLSSGLKSLQAYVTIFENFTLDDIFSGTNTQYDLPSFGPEDAEAITYVNKTNRYFITSETFSGTLFGITFSDYGKLIAFSYKNNTLSISESSQIQISLYPNPVSDVLTIEHQDFEFVEIYDGSMSLVQKSYQSQINMSGLSQGIYFLKINLKGQNPVFKKILKN